MIAKAAMFATCITLACFFPQLFKHKPDYMEAMQRTYFHLRWRASVGRDVREQMK